MPLTGHFFFFIEGVALAGRQTSQSLRMKNEGMKDYQLLNCPLRPGSRSGLRVLEN